MLNYVYKVSLQVEMLRCCASCHPYSFGARVFWAAVCREGSAERCRRWQADKQPALIVTRCLPKTRGSCRLVPSGVVLYADRDGRAHTHTNSLSFLLFLQFHHSLGSACGQDFCFCCCPHFSLVDNSVSKQSLLLSWFYLLYYLFL